jgi:hypothetical protein
MRVLLAAPSGQTVVVTDLASFACGGVIILASLVD